MSGVNKRNPFATAQDFMGGIRTSFEIARDKDRPAEDRPVRISFSVGTGRGNSKPDMTGHEFEELTGFLCDGGTVELTLSSVVNGYNLGPAEIAARTLMMGDGTVEFKTSMASGARTIKVPTNQWGNFTAFLSFRPNVT